MDEDEESTCCEILNETLNIIVGNCMEKFSALGIQAAVCPPFAKQEDTRRAEALMIASSAAACPMDTNAGQVVLFANCLEEGAGDVNDCLGACTCEFATDG
jgi:hypothetical protein